MPQDRRTSASGWPNCALSVLAGGYAADATEDATCLSTAGLASYQVVVFLLTTGDVLDDTQQAAFEAWVGAGGGYVDVHSASDRATTGRSTASWSAPISPTTRRLSRRPRSASNDHLGSWDATSRR
jgi:hypothetical protein